MLYAKKIEQLIGQIKNTLPQWICDLRGDFDKKLRERLQSKLKKLDLVLREEFDIHVKILLSANEKIIEIEKRIEKLEKQLVNKIK